MQKLLAALIGVLAVAVGAPATAATYQFSTGTYRGGLTIRFETSDIPSSEAGYYAITSAQADADIQTQLPTGQPYEYVDGPHLVLQGQSLDMLPRSFENFRTSLYDPVTNRFGFVSDSDFETYGSGDLTATINGMALRIYFGNTDLGPVSVLYLDRAFFIPPAGQSTVMLVSDGVPEPATWAMMVLGFGFVGGSLRKRCHRRLEARCTDGTADFSI